MVTTGVQDTDLGDRFLYNAATASEPPTSDPGDKATLIVKFAQPLQAGSYKVNWQAVSADTHKVKGSFTFQVRPLG